MLKNLVSSPDAGYENSTFSDLLGRMARGRARIVWVAHHMSTLLTSGQCKLVLENGLETCGECTQRGVAITLSMPRNCPTVVVTYKAANSSMLARCVCMPAKLLVPLKLLVCIRRVVSRQLRGDSTTKLADEHRAKIFRRAQFI